MGGQVAGDTRVAGRPQRTVDERRVAVEHRAPVADTRVEQDGRGASPFDEPVDGTGHPLDPLARRQLVVPRPVSQLVDVRRFDVDGWQQVELDLSEHVGVAVGPILGAAAPPGEGVGPDEQAGTLGAVDVGQEGRVDGPGFDAFRAEAADDGEPLARRGDGRPVDDVLPAGHVDAGQHGSLSLIMRGSRMVPQRAA